jgi:hypothetical protein
MKFIILIVALLYGAICGAQTADENSFNQILQPAATAHEEINISEATLKSFNRQYQNVSNAVWNTTPDEGSSVKFSLSGIDHKVFYSKRGRWISTVKNIPAEKLPRYVISRIKLDYPHHNIFFAQHVRTSLGQAYVVSIAKGDTWKQIKLVGNEIEVMGDYVRN